MSLFSVHTATDGAITIYLEEADANLNLLEDIVEQVELQALTLLLSLALTQT